MTKPKSKMPQYQYRGFTIYEVARGRFKVGYGDRGYYTGDDNTLKAAKEAVDRIIESIKNEVNKSS